MKVSIAPYRVFSTSPRVTPHLNKRTQPLFTALLSTPTRRPTSLDPPDYSGSTHTIPTASNDPRLTRIDSCIRSYLTIYITTRVYDQCHSICLSTQSLISWYISTPILLSKLFTPVAPHSHTEITLIIVPRHIFPTYPVPQLRSPTVSQ